MTASLRLMLRRSKGGEWAARVGRCGGGRRPTRERVVGTDRAAPSIALVVAVEKAALQQGAAREPLQASVQIANVDGGRVRNALRSKWRRWVQGYRRAKLLLPELVQCLCRCARGMASEMAVKRSWGGRRARRSGRWRGLELVRNDVSDGGGEKKASVTAVSDAGSEGGRIDAAGGRGGFGRGWWRCCWCAVESGGDWGGVGSGTGR